jgi:hypothetical protein
LYCYTTASGVQIATAAAGSYKGNSYDRLDKISETVIRYGTKSQLQIRRVIDADEEEAEPFARPRAKLEPAPAPAAAAAAPPGGAGDAAGADAGAVGLYTLNPVVTHSLKPPCFNP